MGSETLQLDEVGVGIVGVGLIGGSIAAALKSRGYRGRVIGLGRSVERLQAARDAGMLDDIATRTEEMMPRVSLAVVCTPVDRIAADVRSLAASAQPGTLLTDAGSVKASICRELEPLRGPIAFIGSHPMAGSEKTGFENSHPELFRDRVCIVTPQPGDSPATRQRVAAFWKFLGMRIEELTPAEHDEAVGLTSHFPHLLASLLSAMLPERYRSFVGTGFRDTTRIAAGDPELWRAILEDNAPNLQQAFAAFQKLCDELGLAESGSSLSPGRLKKMLEQAKKNRDALDADN